jgi:hypothetical protein
MNPLIQFKTTILPFLIALVLGCRFRRQTTKPRCSYVPSEKENICQKEES